MFILRRTNWLVIAVVIALALMGGSFDRALATSLTITNWNFEADNPLANGTWAVPTITGWTKSGIAGTFYGEKATNPDEYFLTLPDSGRVAYTNVGSITQTLDPLADPLNAFTAGHLYTLTVDVGNRYSNFTTGRGFPNYSIELLAGGTPLSIDTVFLPTPNYGYFSTATLTYLASDNNSLILNGLLSLL